MHILKKIIGWETVRKEDKQQQEKKVDNGRKREKSNTKTMTNKWNDTI